MQLWVKIAIPLLILCAGIGLAAGLIMAKEKAEKKPREVVRPVVEVAVAAPGSFGVSLPTQGELRPLRETTIAAEVSGRIISVSPKFEVGERFAEGEVLFEIDPADYGAALAAAQAEVANAQLALEQEKAMAKQALRDWEALGEGREATDLVLRKPQLASAEARVTAAAAAATKAERDLERTKVRAPYACQVRAADAELGTFVAAGTPVAQVFSTGALELRLPVSLEDFTFLGEGAGAKVTLSAELGGERAEWEAELVRSEGQVDRTTRSVYLVAKVQPGAGEADQYLTPGLFVRAEVEGKTLEDVFRVPRKALYGRGQIVVVNPDDTVALRKVGVLRTERDEVVINSGLEEGERIVVSPMAEVIDGMEVEIAGEEVDAAGDGEIDGGAGPEGGPAE